METSHPSTRVVETGLNCNSHLLTEAVHGLHAAETQRRRCAAHRGTYVSEASEFFRSVGTTNTIVADFSQIASAYGFSERRKQMNRCDRTDGASTSSNM